jgi:SAM-dependent methyltransferase
MSLSVSYAGCPLCGGAGSFLRDADCTPHPLWSDALPPRLEWHACGACAHVYTRSYWTAEGLRVLFSRALPHQVAGGDPDAKRVSWQPVVRRAVDLLGGYRAVMGESPAWIDAGCGDGGLVMTAGEYGFHAVGIDARRETVEAIVALGFEAVEGDFLSAPLAPGAAVVSMMDVLEHLPFPREGLDRAAALLRPGGLLVLSLPDRETSSWRIMDLHTGNPYWMEIEHHHNFSRTRLAHRVAEHGLWVVDFAIAYRYKALLDVYAPLSAGARAGTTR